MAAPFFLVRSLFGVKFYWWKTHGKVRAPKERFALLFCDCVYTAGSKSFDVVTNKLRVVGHAIDTNKFVVENDGARDPYQCLVLGRIVPIKKIEVALSACSEVSKFEPKVRLDIVGFPDNVAYLKTLELQVVEGKLREVHFRAAVSPQKVTDYYRQANILIHPAYEAGFDKVVLEAMASGVVPITSIPSFELVLSPYGLYVPPNDIQGYVTVITKILHMQREERMILGRRLREIVINEHSLETLNRRIFKFEP